MPLGNTLIFFFSLVLSLVSKKSENSRKIKSVPDEIEKWVLARLPVRRQ